MEVLNGYEADDRYRWFADQQRGGHFTAKPTQITDECWINVTVDGKLAGKSKFRVRTIPTPIATVGGVMSNENMTVGQFKAQSGVAAYSPNFPFDLKYAVTGFTFVQIMMTETWKKQFGGVRPGTKKAQS